MRPFLIGIAGRSGAGKSEIARQLGAWLPGKTEAVSLDSYYWAMDHVPLAERGNVNFDHPDSLDWPLIVEHIEALSRGEMIAEPIYIFATHTRAVEKRPVMPSRYVILEGLFTLHDARVRDRLDAKIYIETPDEVCFERRKVRDIVERGRTAESVEKQYASTVRPMAEQFVSPTSQYADLVLRGDMPLAETIAVVKAFLQPPVLSRPIPVLPVDNVTESVRFYTDRLGFESLGAGRVRRDAVELQFMAKASAEGLEVKVTEIEKLFRECAGALPPDARIRAEHGGRKSFSVVDNNGLAVTFYES
jgi:uridine kinase